MQKLKRTPTSRIQAQRLQLLVIRVVLWTGFAVAILALFQHRVS